MAGMLVADGGRGFTSGLAAQAAGEEGGHTAHTQRVIQHGRGRAPRGALGTRATPSSAVEVRGLAHL